MIYLPAKNYNLPGSFGADAEFPPRFAEGRRNGKFIIGCRGIVLIGTITVKVAMIVNPLVPQVPPVLLNPFISVVEFVIPVALNRSPVARVFLIKMVGAPDDRLLVDNRPVIRPATVGFCMDPLFNFVFAMPVFPAVGPGSTRENKYQPGDQHTDFHNCLFHGLASFCLNLIV